MVQAFVLKLHLVYFQAALEEMLDDRARSLLELVLKTGFLCQTRLNYSKCCIGKRFKSWLSSEAE